MYDWLESLKTYAVAAVGMLVSSMQFVCDAIESVTIILVFISVVIRLVNDVPLVLEKIRKYREERKL